MSFHFKAKLFIFLYYYSEKINLSNYYNFLRGYLNHLPVKLQVKNINTKLLRWTGEPNMNEYIKINLVEI